MSLKRSLLAIFLCSSMLGCGAGEAPAPAPVGRQDPLPDPQQPASAGQTPAPDPQTPAIGGEEPLQFAQEPVPPHGEAGASANDR